MIHSGHGYEEALKRLTELEALILRLDWENIHTHYGHTNCDDCLIVQELRFMTAR